LHSDENVQRVSFNVVADRGFWFLELIRRREAGKIPEAYNFLMVWSKWIWIVGPIVAILGWPAAAVVRAWLEGTPLNGLRKLRGKTAAPSKKTALSVVVLTAPEPRWHIGAMAKTPMLNLTFHANIAHKSDESIKILKVYLKGTEPYGVFIPFFVAGPYDPPVQIHFSVRQVIVEGREKLTRRVILLDHFGGEHETVPVTFAPGLVTPQQCGLNDQNPTIKCYVCDQPIGMTELHEASAIPVHKRCVK
jgi:hypothetical protein